MTDVLQLRRIIRQDRLHYTDDIRAFSMYFNINGAVLGERAACRSQAERIARSSRRCCDEGEGRTGS